MNQDLNKNNSEEVDLIRLLNYFKKGIKSIFLKIWKLIELFIDFILILKKNWILVLGLMLLGAIYGKFLQPAVFAKDRKKYEMIVRTNPIANYELYSYAIEVNNNDTNKKALKEIGISASETTIKGIQISPIPKLEDVIQNYFQQIENATIRGFETDTLYYQTFDIKAAKSNLENTDYPLQKIVFTTKGSIDTKEVQNKFINYFNNLPTIKEEQQARYEALSAIEKEVQTDLNAIDSIMFNRAIAARKTGPATGEQVLVNSASRANVESDLMIHSEKLTKKLYGVKRAKQNVERGVTVISNLRISKGDGIMTGGTVVYAVYGFVLASIILLVIQFNKYLEKRDQSRKNKNA